MVLHTMEPPPESVRFREELAIVSRTLGHADLSTTADIYAHLTPAMLERTAARMDASLGRCKEAASG